MLNLNKSENNISKNISIFTEMRFLFISCGLTVTANKYNFFFSLKSGKYTANWCMCKILCMYCEYDSKSICITIVLFKKYYKYRSIF